MAKITRVQKAQQRYEQVPVIDPATGEQKRTPVMRNGKQRVTKRGEPIFLSVTANDKTKPLPNRTCGKCHQEIKVGSPYKHISPRSGPYGGRTMYRCDTCPDWHVWEYSSSLSARTAEISYNFWESFNDTTFESVDDVQNLLNEAAEAIREIAQEKEESADNIEEGFQHETQQSQELREVSESLNSWADDVEGVSLTDFPEPEEADCEECKGVGHLDLQEELGLARKRLAALQAKLPTLTDLDDLSLNQAGRERETKAILVMTKLVNAGEVTTPCEVCEETGRFEPEEPTEEQVDEWVMEVESECSIVDECPV